MKKPVVQSVAKARILRYVERECGSVSADDVKAIDSGMQSLYESYDAKGTYPTAKALANLLLFVERDTECAVRAMKGDPFGTSHTRSILLGSAIVVVAVAFAGAVAFAPSSEVPAIEAQLGEMRVGTGWQTADDGSTRYYVDDGSLAKGWLVEDTNPSGVVGQPERYWLDPETGLLAKDRTVKTSDTSYAYATEDGSVARGTYDDGAGHVYLANDEGTLRWGGEIGWVVADYGHGVQRYRVEAGTHAARTGFFDVAGYGKYLGTSDGFVLCGVLPQEGHVLLADGEGKLADGPGWLESDIYEGSTQRYCLECVYSDGYGVKYYGARTGLFDYDGALYYGSPETGAVVCNETLVIDDREYKADETGALTEIVDWTLEEPDWGQDDDYLESCRSRAEANGSDTDYYITVDNRWEGGGRVIVFKREDTGWTALAGWYANVGRWTGSGDNRGTRSIPGLYKVTHKFSNCHGGPGLTAEPYWWTCYLDAWTGFPHDEDHDDGQGFHYTPSEIPGNTQEGCCALSESRAKWIYDNIPIGTSVDVFGAAHGVNYD